MRVLWKLCALVLIVMGLYLVASAAGLNILILTVLSGDDQDVRHILNAEYRTPPLTAEEELLMQLLIEEQGMLTPEEAAFLEILCAEEDPTLDAHEE